MNSGEKLEEMFRKFPGIGGRQAKRFVYFLLGQSNGFTEELSGLLTALKKDISQCSKCFRFFPNGGLPAPTGAQASDKICPACASKTADASPLPVIEKDIDFETVQKSGTYQGLYFILGGLVPIMDKDPAKLIRIKKLVERVKRDSEKKI